jgi:hypothetical protein
MSSPRFLAGATTPTRSARADLLLRARDAPIRTLWRVERPPPRAPARGRSRIPHVRLDHSVAGSHGGCDAVPAIADVEHVADTRQAHRRCLASLLEPRAVQLDLRLVEAATAEANLCQRDQRCCERRFIWRTPPSSRSNEMRTGGVEPPQPEATRLQRGGLSRAQRPQEGRSVGFRTDTAGITTQSACRYTMPPPQGGTRSRGFPPRRRAPCGAQLL